MNKYTPWIELGISELEYYKKLYLEERARVKYLVEQNTKDLKIMKELIDSILEDIKQYD